MALASSLLITMMTPAAAECFISYNGTQDVLDVFDANGNRFNFPSFSQVCEKLRMANADLRIVGNYDVLSGRALGVAQVYVTDNKNTNISPFLSSHAIKVNLEADTPTARHMLYDSVNAALETFNRPGGLDKALADLDEARAALAEGR